MGCFETADVPPERLYLVEREESFYNMTRVAVVSPGRTPAIT